MEVVLLRQEVNTEWWDTSQEWFIQRRYSLVLIAPSCFSRGNGSQDFVHVRQTVHHRAMGWTLSYIFNSLVSAAPSTQSPNQQVLSDIRTCVWAFLSAYNVPPPDACVASLSSLRSTAVWMSSLLQRQNTRSTQLTEELILALGSRRLESLIAGTAWQPAQESSHSQLKARNRKNMNC